MRIPLKAQVGAVVALFVAALAALWTTGASVVAREGRLASAGQVLARAGAELADRGRATLGEIPRWPAELDRREWDELGARLGAGAGLALAPFEGVEGGYFLQEHRRFLGSAFPTERKPPEAKKKAARARDGGPPPREVELIEIQADAAIRRNEPRFVVEVVPPSVVAIRTTPVAVDGRTVSATWTMTRLVDPLFLDQSLRGYRIAAGLALGGIALALALTLNLSRTVRRQAAERDRLQAELRRSERLAALGRLLAGVAHEVRNPLAGIRSTAQLWRRGIGRDASSCDDLCAEVDRLDEIVARLLQFSRADGQDLRPNDLDAVAAEAARLALGPAEARGVEIITDLAGDLPPAMMAPTGVLQVLRNLTTNAIHAMPGGGRLRISTRAAQAPGRVEVEVADTGGGLAPEVVAHLFEPFFTTKSGGTGLGLAIAREIALAHRGDLRAVPRPDGASFILTLPLAPENRSDAER